MSENELVDLLEDTQEELIKTKGQLALALSMLDELGYDLSYFDS